MAGNSDISPMHDTGAEARLEAIRSELRTDVSSAINHLKQVVREVCDQPDLRKEAVMVLLEVTDLIELNKLGNPPEWSPEAQEIIRRAEKLIDDTLRELKKTGPDRGTKTRVVQEFFHQQVPDETTVFRGKGIGKTYTSGNPPFTLGPLDLELKYGQITGVVGENGNGKSTLLKIVAGQLRHDSGTLEYPALCNDPQSMNWHNVKHCIGYIPQRLEKWSGTVKENLRFAAAIKGILGKDNDQELEFILRRLNLTKYQDANWAGLSGGYQMRFELARTLIWKPKLLILDEPLANLDINAQLMFLKDLRFLADSLRNPLTVILSSQHLHKIEMISDRVIFLRAGQAIFNGPASEIGVDRQVNIFEIAGDFDAGTLRRILKDLDLRQVKDEGSTVLVQVGLGVLPADVLSAVSGAGHQVQFFRDISRSTRQFFEITA